MTDDEQEALSFKYIAPRVLRLSSGRFALIHMIGPTRVEVIDSLDAVPTTDSLATDYNTREERLVTIRRTKAAATRTTHKATLDDLA